MYVNGNCIFFTDSTPVPRLPVLHTLLAGVPNLGREEEREVLGSLGECPPNPALGRGRVGHFSRPVSQQPAWPPRRTAFRDAGPGRSKDRLSGRAFIHPLPGGSQARVPALGHLLPARESKHPGQAIPALGNPEKLRATRRIQSL